MQESIYYYQNCIGTKNLESFFLNDASAAKKNDRRELLHNTVHILLHCTTFVSTGCFTPTRLVDISTTVSIQLQTLKILLDIMNTYLCLLLINFPHQDHKTTVRNTGCAHLLVLLNKIWAETILEYNSWYVHQRNSCGYLFFSLFDQNLT